MASSSRASGVSIGNLSATRSRRSIALQWTSTIRAPAWQACWARSIQPCRFHRRAPARVPQACIAPRQPRPLPCSALLATTAVRAPRCLFHALLAPTLRSQMPPLSPSAGSARWAPSAMAARTRPQRAPLASIRAPWGKVSAPTANRACTPSPPAPRRVIRAVLAHTRMRSPVQSALWATFARWALRRARAALGPFRPLQAEARSRLTNAAAVPPCTCPRASST